MMHLFKILQEAFSEELKSRVHKINSMQSTQLETYIKRDDELSFSASGSKIRKMTSIIPYIQSQNPKQVAIIGSALSHFVVALSQRCLENQIPFVCYLKKPHLDQQTGNALLLNLLNPPIQWIESKEWPFVEKIAKEACDLIIPEGGYIKEAFEGCCTLGLDIERNEEELDLCFDHIILDAGSSLTAICLILYFGIRKSPKSLHIISCADSHPLFQEKLEKFSSLISEKYQLPKPSSFRYHFYRPYEGKSFGSTPSSIFNYIRIFARKEGVFLDPLYSAKLFQTFEKTIQPTIKGKALLVHSGGGTSLFSFTSSLWEPGVFSSTRGHNHR